ncbi:chitinase, partial [Streptomyces mirabilis]
MDRTERTRPSTRQRLLAVCTATVLAVPGLAALSWGAPAAPAVGRLTARAAPTPCGRVPAAAARAAVRGVRSGGDSVSAMSWG